MLAGHVVARGTRLVAGLRPGLSTRATYTTAQDVTLWPIEIRAVSYHQDRSALAAAGIGAVGRPGRAGGAAGDAGAHRGGPGSARRARARPAGPALRQPRQGAGALRRALRRGRRRRARGPPRPGSRCSRSRGPSLVGIADGEALMPRTRAGFEGYRLLREYFMMPERFHYARLDGLRPVVARSTGALEVVFLLRRPVPELADVHPGDLRLFVTPVINLFERDCNVVEIDPRRPRQVHPRRPHPPARLRDLPADRARGRRPRRAGGAHPAALRLRPGPGPPGLVGRAPAAPPRRGRAAAGPHAHLLCRRRPLPHALRPAGRRPAGRAQAARRAGALHQPRHPHPRRPAGPDRWRAATRCRR